MTGLRAPGPENPVGFFRGLLVAVIVGAGLWAVLLWLVTR